MNIEKKKKIVLHKWTDVAADTKQFVFRFNRSEVAVYELVEAAVSMLPPLLF